MDKLRKVAFLRGINVSGKNKVPMSDLVLLCESLNWHVETTFLQTGNVIFSNEGNNQKLEKELEMAIKSKFAFSVPVIVRNLDSVLEVVNGSPFSEQAIENPSKVILYFCKKPILENAQEYLIERAKGEEEVLVNECCIWIYFPNGVGKSKLTPAGIDRAAGSATTGRNWNTVSKICSKC